jgi:hypothetical protein
MVGEHSGEVARLVHDHFVAVHPDSIAPSVDDVRVYIGKAGVYNPSCRPVFLLYPRQRKTT